MYLFFAHIALYGETNPHQWSTAVATTSTTAIYSFGKKIIVDLIILCFVWSSQSVDWWRDRGLVPPRRHQQRQRRHRGRARHRSQGLWGQVQAAKRSEYRLASLPNNLAWMIQVGLRERHFLSLFCPPSQTACIAASLCSSRIETGNVKAHSTRLFALKRANSWWNASSFGPCSILTVILLSKKRSRPQISSRPETATRMGSSLSRSSTMTSTLSKYPFWVRSWQRLIYFSEFLWLSSLYEVRSWQK